MSDSKADVDFDKYFDSVFEDIPGEFFHPFDHKQIPFVISILRQFYIAGTVNSRLAIEECLTKDIKRCDDGSYWPQPHIRLDRIIKIVRGES